MNHVYSLTIRLYSVLKHPIPQQETETFATGQIFRELK